jgi:plasmid segregation protein ParM
MPRTKTVNLVGVDVGYSHTKICAGEKGDKVDSFRSTVRVGEIDINKKSTVIGFDGEVYTVGENTGRQIFETNKIYDINFDICLMASIARTHDESEVEVNLVTGLPIAYYQAQKDELVKALKNKEYNFTYNGEERKVNIREVAVFPQSAGLPLLYPNEFDDKVVLVVDIGGFTVDVSLFGDKRLSKFNSYDKGVLMFHKHLAKFINSKYSTRYDFQDMERVIDHGIIINEEKVEDSDSIIKKQHELWVQSILDDVKADFPWSNGVDSRTFIGGGSIAFKDYLPQTKSIKSDEVHANSKAFYNVGVQLFD